MASAVVEYGRGDEDLDLRQLFSCLWRARLWVIGSVVLFTATFAAIAFLTTPVYRATAVLTSAGADHSGSELGSLSALTSIVGIDVESLGDTRTEEALAVLRSREFTEDFIADQQLLPELYSGLWDPKEQHWRVDSDARPTLARAYKYFNEIRMAAKDQKTGLIKVQIEWRDPIKAASWVNEIVARLNTVMRARSIEKTDAYLVYLQKELAVTPAVETRQTISRLMETQINERMLASVTEDYAFRVVDKAMVPDVNDPVRPKKMLLIMLGGITGFFVAASGVFVFGAIGDNALGNAAAGSADVSPRLQA